MMTSTRSGPSVLAALPGRLATDLFTGAKPVRLDANEVLFIAGDPGDGCYRIEDGLLKVTMVSRSGSERILAFLGPGAIVGELSMIDGRPRSASVVAVREAALSFLSRAAFDVFARKHPEVYQTLVALLASRLRETDIVIAAGSFLKLKGRVAATLLELAENFGQDVGSGRIVIRQKSSGPGSTIRESLCVPRLRPSTPSRVSCLEPDQCLEAITASVTYPIVTDIMTTDVLRGLRCHH